MTGGSLYPPAVRCLRAVREQAGLSRENAPSEPQEVGGNDLRDLDWLVAGADRSALCDRWLQERKPPVWVDPERHQKLRERQASRFRIVIPASGGGGRRDDRG